jgi:hypothetical protein
MKYEDYPLPQKRKTTGAEVGVMQLHELSILDP